VSKAFDKTYGHWVQDEGKHNRYIGGGVLRCDSGLGGSRYDKIRFSAHKLGSKLREPVITPFSTAALNHEVLALEPAELSEFVIERAVARPLALRLA
jgi:hypothetical protein